VLSLIAWPCLLSSLYSTTVQTRIQYNDNSTRSYENQSVYRAVSKIVKTAINTAIAVKLLKSKVTLGISQRSMRP
jgi:hypothetical protein